MLPPFIDPPYFWLTFDFLLLLLPFTEPLADEGGFISASGGRIGLSFSSLGSSSASTWVPSGSTDFQTVSS